VGQERAQLWRKRTPERILHNSQVDLKPMQDARNPFFCIISKQSVISPLKQLPALVFLAYWLKLHYFVQHVYGMSSGSSTCRM
jgi:hypothetical protein